MILPVALAVTWRGDRATKFRSLVLAVAVAAVTLFVCATASALLMVEQVNQRDDERTFRYARPEEEADLSGGGAIYDSIGGEQILVDLWRIETPGVRLPGVPADAEVGEWFVSPELARRIEIEPSLQNRYFDARVIGAEGVGSADELLALRLVGPEVDLGFRHMAEASPGYSGSAAGVTASNVLGGAAVVLVAAIGLLRAALGPVSVGLDRRLRILSLLGATSSRIWLQHAASVAVVAVPAAAVATAAWYLVAPRLEAVPLVGQRVLEGDLAMPIWVAAAAASASVALVVVVGISRPHSREGSRSTAGTPLPPGVWRIVPLVASLGLIVYATTLSGTSGAPKLFITGLLAASLAVVLALPVVIYWVGERLATGGTALALLVGRSLGSNARVSPRSLTAVASLAVLVPVAASYIALARAPDPAPPPASVATIHVYGKIDAASLDRLGREAGGTFVEVYRQSDLTDLSKPSTSTWVADCRSLERVVELQSCGPDGILVDPAAEAAFTRFDAATTEPPAGATLESWLFITHDDDRAEDVLRYHMVNSDDSRISVTSRADSETKEARSVAWILAAIKIGAAVAGAALLLSVITSSSHSAGIRLRLAGIGADLRMIRRLAAAESAATVMIVGLGGVAVGTVGAVAYALVDGSAMPFYLPSLVIAAAVLATAAMAAAASALCVSGTSLQAILNVRD